MASSTPDEPTGGRPAGPLDVEILERWANAFFTAMPVPSGVPAGTSPVSGGASYAPLAPGAPPAPTDLSVLSSAAPPPSSVEPQAPSIEQPTTPLPSARSVPTTPYYFLAEAVALVPSAAPAPAADRLMPEVPALAAAAPPEEAMSWRSGGPEVPPALPDFYFLDATPSAAAPEPPPAAEAVGPFDVNAVRADFPILSEQVNGHQLVWLDNAATTQKPQSVIDRLAHYYEHENSNVHRAAHELAARSTDAYEGARNKVARFLGASSPDEIVFVRGATEAVNLVAQSWGRQNVGPGDEIVVSHLEHHANIVPWMRLCEEKDAKLRVIPVDDSGQIILEEYTKLLNDRTRMVSVAHVSNALGTIVPVDKVVEAAHAAGACVLVDGAQSVAHIRVDVRSLGSDFYVFSGHKIFGPTGVGVLYGKPEVLDAMPPWQGGGNMIKDVTFERVSYQQAPLRFEAGTGTIADAVGLGAALDYLERLGLENVARYEHELLVYATHAMQAVPGLRMIGCAPDKASVLSFVLHGYRPEEVGSALNKEGIAVRAGHHCAQPILRRFGVEATVRPSLALYNTHGEVDRMVATLHHLAARAGTASA
jgi:cysteine desulfurase/selenocysteine lyase